MATGQKIRVIKQHDRLTAKAGATRPTQSKPAAQPDPSRSVKDTVSSWIRDFREHRVQETRHAFNSLFKDSGLRTA